MRVHFRALLGGEACVPGEAGVEKEITWIAPYILMKHGVDLFAWAQNGTKVALLCTHCQNSDLRCSCCHQNNFSVRPANISIRKHSSICLDCGAKNDRNSSVCQICGMLHSCLNPPQSCFHMLYGASGAPWLYLNSQLNLSCILRTFWGCLEQCIPAPEH